MLIDDHKYLVDALSPRVGERPASEFFSHTIEKRHTALCIGHNHGIADAGERNLQLVTLGRRLLLRRCARAHLLRKPLLRRKQISAQHADEHAVKNKERRMQCGGTSR